MPRLSNGPDRLFRALGDSTRRAVVHRLCRGAETVGGLAAPHPMALPSFLQHLDVLEKSGWIRSRKTGRVRICRINPAALRKAGAWLEAQRVLWERRLNSLDDYLRRMDKEERP